MRYEQLLDTVAEAIFARKYASNQSWSNVPDFVQQIYREHAIAALPVIYEILREPTAEMVDAANRIRQSTMSRIIQAAIEASPLNAESGV